VPDVANALGVRYVDELRAITCNSERLGEVSNDVLVDPVGKMLLFGITAHVVEREHGDGGFVGNRRRRGSGRRANSQCGCLMLLDDNAEYLDRPHDVLDGMIASDVHAVTIDILAVDDDVADVDSYPKPDPFVFGAASIVLANRFLNLDPAGNGIDRAGELDERPVAHQFDHATRMLGDRTEEVREKFVWVTYVRTVRPSCRRSGLLDRYRCGDGEHYHVRRMRLYHRIDSGTAMVSVVRQ
jgi:hypothetical protein